MSNILSLPEVQSAVVPLLLALALGLSLNKSAKSLVGLGLVVAFLASAYLINGLHFSPLTGTRKIIIVSLLATVVALSLALIGLKSSLRRPVIGAVAMFAMLWVFWKYLGQQPLWIASIWVIVGTAYVVWQAFIMDRSAHDALASTSVLAALGVGTGLTAILGGSALLGQLGLAMGAAAGGLWFVAVVQAGWVSNCLVTLPSNIVLALLGLAAVAFANVPWYALIPLALLPLLAGLSIPVQQRWVRGILQASLAMLVAGTAPIIVWLGAGPASGY